MVNQAVIKVIGVGGAGGNAVEAMTAASPEGVDFIAANTDVQALARSSAARRIQLGESSVRGLGAGGNPAVGSRSASEAVPRIAEALQGSDMVFVTAGLGGGTGTGAAPVVADAARDLGALTVGVVTTPFPFEGGRRQAQARAGLTELEHRVDALLVIPNERVLEHAGDDVALLEAFSHADQVLGDAVRAISDLVVHTGMINVDFADVAAVMRMGGRAMMGRGSARGRDRAASAAHAAMTSPLLDEGSIEGSSGILLNFRAGPDLRLREVHEAAAQIEAAAHEEAEIIFGVVQDPEMHDTLELTLVATGLGHGGAQDALPREGQLELGAMGPRRNAVAGTMVEARAATVPARPRNALRFLT